MFEQCFYLKLISTLSFPHKRLILIFSNLLRLYFFSKTIVNYIQLYTVISTIKVQHLISK